MYSFSYLEPVCCSMSSSNCCFLTYIQVSQEAGQVVWYSHLFKNFPQFVVIHTVKGASLVAQLVKNLPAGQEVTVRTRHGATVGFKIGKGVCQGCILSPCLFNLHAEYIMWNVWLDESQTGIKTAGRNINHLRYADDNTLMAESEEELKSLLMRVKGESE